MRTYDDLQLRIDRDADGTYRTLAMAADGRTARGVFHLPVTDDELDDFVQRVGLVRRRRGLTEDRLRVIKEFGSNLFDALFADQVGNVYSAARAAASNGDRRLRITLHLSGAPELMRLPWELLYHRPRFIAQSTDTPIIRTLDVDSARRPHRLMFPLRILGIASSPVGYQQLDAESERRNLETALEPLRRAGLVELIWLERATLRDLARRVSEPDEIHVIHYIGHGAYSEENEAGILVLETPEGRAHDVAGEEIGAMLQDARALRLVVLNSCDGARTSHIDPFSGVATSLIEFDIPAVVGMQFEITDLAAIAFSESLYTGLAHGMPIDAAMGPARRAIMAMTTAEFGTPVLFLRDGDARLFDIDKESLARSSPVDPAVKPPTATTTADPIVEPPAVAETVHSATQSPPAATKAAAPTERMPEAIEAVATAESPSAARTKAAPAVDPLPAATKAIPTGDPPPTATSQAVPTADPPPAATTKAVPTGESLPARKTAPKGRTFWVTAFALGLFGTLASLMTFDSSPIENAAAILWMAGTALAAVFAAIAVRISGVRHRTLGVVLAACSVLPGIMPFAAQAAWPTTIASLLQIAILFGVMRLTRAGRGAPQPPDNRFESKR
jgi:hypothetical protein